MSRAKVPCLVVNLQTGSTNRRISMFNASGRSTYGTRSSKTRTASHPFGCSPALSRGAKFYGVQREGSFMCVSVHFRRMTVSLYHESWSRSLRDGPDNLFRRDEFDRPDKRWRLYIAILYSRSVLLESGSKPPRGRPGVYTKQCLH